MQMGMSMGLEHYPVSGFSNVVLLSGFEAANLATSAPDESSFGGTLTMSNGSPNCFVTTADKKFGTASVRRTMTQKVSIGDSTRWNFGSNPWTVEAWIKFNTIQATFEYIVAHYDINAQRSWALLKNGSLIQIALSSDGGAATTLASADWSPSTGVWYHVAADYDGTSYRTYVDGAMKGKTTTAAIAPFDSPAELTLCTALSNGAVNGGYDGWMDEVRITRGLARYASDAGYTVPAEAFPRA
jgi:hypothetical protein